MKTSNPNKIINWGIIGLGSIAHTFAQDLVGMDTANLYAVASRTQIKADAFAEKFNSEKAYSSYEALVKDPLVDAVYIATPHTLHFENTLLCLAHNKPVLCEKAFAMNLLQVKDMVKTAKANNVLLMEALWTRFIPSYQYVLKAIKNNTYGPLIKVEASFGFYRAFDDSSRLFNKSLGGGSLLDIGIYPIFAALSSLGEPDKIKAQATFFENGADSSCDMVFSYKNGEEAYLKSSLLEDLPTEAIFYFEHGLVKLNKPFHTPTSVTVEADGKTETKTFAYTTNGYSYEINHFNDLIRQGRTESDLMSFSFSEQLIGLLDRVRNKIDLIY